MSTTVLVEIKVKDGDVAKIQPMFVKRLAETRDFDGNLGVAMYTEADAPATFVIVEHWGTRAQYDAYNKWRSDRGDIAELSALLAGPPVRRFFSDIGA